MAALTPEERECRDALAGVLRYLRPCAEQDAERLIADFGSLPRLFAGDEGRLRAAVPADAAELILALKGLIDRHREARTPVLTLASFDQILVYLREALSAAEVEQLRVLFFAPGNRLLKAETVATGSIDRCPIYPREILRRALQLNAATLILAHNHPSGDPAPSRADIAVTRDLIEGGRRLGIVVHDHIIIAATGHVSLRAKGLI